MLLELMVRGGGGTVDAHSLGLKSEVGDAVPD